MLQLFKGHRHMNMCMCMCMCMYTHSGTISWYSMDMRDTVARGRQAAVERSHTILTHSAARGQSPPLGSTRGPTRILFCHPRLLGPTTRPPRPRRASPLAPPVPPTTIDVMGTGLSTSPSASTVAGGILRPGSQPHVRPPRAPHAWQCWPPRPGRPLSSSCVGT